jgi:hypothetical protein
MTNGYYIHDDHSFADVVNLSASSVTNGVTVGGGTTSDSIGDYPEIRVATGRLGFITTTAVNVLAKANLIINDVVIDDDSGLFVNQVHLKVVNPALPGNPNHVVGNGNILRADKVDVFGGATNNPPVLSGTFFSDIPGDISRVVLSNMSVGTALLGHQIDVGGGGSHTLGIIVFEDNGGVFTDKTSAVKYKAPNPIVSVIATTGQIDLASAPATIDGVTPSSGVTAVLVKDGSTANAGTTSVDNGIYVWNGTGSAMTRSGLFPVGNVYTHDTFFSVTSGTVNYGSLWKIDASSIASDEFTVGTTAFGLEAYSTPAFASPATDDDALYIGSAIPLVFPGVFMLLTKPLTLSGGTIGTTLVWEYWDGSAWSTVPIMSTHSEEPYDLYAEETYGFDDASVGAPDPVGYQYRFGDLSDWSTVSVNSVTAYWVRSRLIGASNISQIPIIDEIKLHTNRTTMNKDGFLEFFGVARPTKKINVSSRELFEPDNSATLTRPNNQALVSADSGGIQIRLNIVDCQMDVGNDTVQGYAFEMPKEMDTSEPCVLKIWYVRDTGGGGSGDLALRADYVFTPDGAIYGVPAGTPSVTPTSSGIVTVAVPAAGGAQGSHEFVLDTTTNFHPATDILWVQFGRHASDVADTFGDSIFVFKWTLSYRAWATGGF